MSATEELRRLLDARGVKWKSSKPYVTWFYDQRGNSCESANWTEENMTLSLYDLTPAEALEAALGRGECWDSAGSQMAFFSCSACGATIEHKHPRFCFACGRKVVDE